MQIKIQIDESCKEPEVIILTDKITEEVNEIMRKLSEERPEVLAGFRGDTLEILEKNEVFRIFSQSGKVFAITGRGEYILRQRLYELEEKLIKDSFVRISNSEIVNLRKIKSFDLSFAGTICVVFTDGTSTYVSRRYVSKIKSILGI